MITLDTPLSDIPAIKERMLAKLKRLDILTVRDLFFHLPHRYEDYSEIRPIAALIPDEKCTVLGTVVSIEAGRTFRKRMFLTEVVIEDATGRLRALWFNQRFVSQMLKEGMPVRLSGKVSQDKQGFIMQNPAVERAARDATHTARLVPVYPETAGLTSKFFRWQIAELFAKIAEFPDPVPADILERLHLPSQKAALAYMHFPKDAKHSLLAEKRFAFDEMFLMQLKTLEVKALFETAKAKALPFDDAALARFKDSLPFALTRAQEKASDEILSDLSAAHPMNRLLNGDVGSGKTAVAAIAAFVAAEHGTQTALLAPTEVLARQHFESLSRLFAGTGHSIALLTGSYRILDGDTVTRPTLLRAIKAGIPSIVIGTHALLEEDVAFQDLALIVVDEQHRFGVAQRAKLQDTILTDTDLTQTHTDTELLYEELTYKIRGAVFNVKKQLGLGHKEVIYQKALAEELKKSGVAFSKEESIDIRYDNKKIGTYRPDFIADKKVILELKALPSIGKFEKQQVWHYLKGSEYPLALLINFGRDDVEFERFINTGQHKSASSPHRSALTPHFLTMTATPIPRTFTLALFGNLDLSLLDEMPSDRKPIITKLADTDKKREQTYEFIRSEIGKGRQAFVILPLVEESEAMKDVKAAVAERERLAAEVFPHLSIGLLHGKLKTKEKEAVMRDFKDRKYDILVATAVVEVGIDVPNATVIMIEEAERFGLSQLHQFRGRVGRGEHQSYCFLLPHQHSASAESLGGQAGKNGAENGRLKALTETTSGFDIAEADLALRGPGAFFGTRQSGLPDIAMENLTNMKLIQIARDEAAAILKADPELKEHPLLRAALRKFEEKIHLE